ncbi:MAG: DUF423 domain-containing protein [Bacteroidetes bacterium]|nr:DUF423 domain-containing protein [Bacteroidota bacterium]
MNFRVFYLLVGLMGATAVALGALGAHFLKTFVDLGVLTPASLASFETAVKYHLIHSVVLLMCIYFAKHYNNSLLRAAAYLFFAGVILFSGSIYFLSTKAITQIEGLSWLGPITPLGGLCMIAGWLCLGFGLYKTKHHSHSHHNEHH